MENIPAAADVNYQQCLKCKTKSPHLYCQKCFQSNENYIVFVNFKNQEMPSQGRKRRSRGKDFNHDEKQIRLEVLQKILDILDENSTLENPRNTKLLNDDRVPGSSLNSDSGKFEITHVPSKRQEINMVLKNTSDSSSKRHEDDICMFCHNAPKNGIFLHTFTAHCCCCYNCAKRLWK
ncbi:hypothetical protein ABEB36_015764 [Hypothenemus hampei]|uniref:Uncharacterized protein n=1 Tax=Hypothenemus hampei TaxID=57062 RepID=A0ABD1E1D7_HYPHA